MRGLVRLHLIYSSTVTGLEGGKEQKKRLFFAKQSHYLIENKWRASAEQKNKATRRAFGACKLLRSKEKNKPAANPPRA